MNPIRSLAQKDENTPIRESLFFETGSLPDYQHIPSETIIFIQLRRKKEIIYANQNFKRAFGPVREYLGHELDTWCSLVQEEYQEIIQTKISSFFSSPGKEGVCLLYPIIGRNRESLLLEHKIYRCQFHAFSYMVNLITILKRTQMRKYFFDSVNPPGKLHREERAVCVSKREKQVLQLIANGYSSKEIADKLFISNHTAISHRKNLIEKFEVRNTAHLIKKTIHLIHGN